MTQNYRQVPISEIIEKIERGDCPPINKLKVGEMPVVTTTESNNGVYGLFEPEGSIHSNKITIPANGSKYKAFYHPYEFVANADVLICTLKEEYDTIEMKIYFCSIYNKNSWRFSYFRKCTEDKILEDLTVPMPINSNGEINLKEVNSYINEVPEYKRLMKLLK